MKQVLAWQRYTYLCVRELFDIEVEGTQTAPKSMELFDSTILNVLCLAKARQHAHA